MNAVSKTPLFVLFIIAALSVTLFEVNAQSKRPRKKGGPYEFAIPCKTAMTPAKWKRFKEKIVSSNPDPETYYYEYVSEDHKKETIGKRTDLCNCGDCVGAKPGTNVTQQSSLKETRELASFLKQAF